MKLEFYQNDRPSEAADQLGEPLIVYGGKAPSTIKATSTIRNAETAKNGGENGAIAATCLVERAAAICTSKMLTSKSFKVRCSRPSRVCQPTAIRFNVPDRQEGDLQVNH